MVYYSHMDFTASIVVLLVASYQGPHFLLFPLLLLPLDTTSTKLP